MHEKELKGNFFADGMLSNEMVIENDINGSDENEIYENFDEEKELVKPSKALKKHRKKKGNPLVTALSNIFPWKGDSRGEIFRKSVFLLCIIILGISLSFIINYFLGASDAEGNISRVQEERDRILSESASQSYVEGEVPMLADMKYFVDEVNSDIVGWITIDDTKVDLPVLQALDNEYYLDRDVYRDKSEYGAIFLDYRNKFTDKEQSDNLVIYGHDTTTNAMFGDLDQYHFSGMRFLKEHPSIKLNSNYKRSEYIIFGVIITNANERDGEIWPYHNILEFGSEEEFNAYVLEAKKRSIYKTYLDVEYGEKLITLSTCATTMFEDARLVIIAREVRDGEDVGAYIDNYETNPNPLYPDRWYQIRGGRYIDDPDASY